MAATDLKLGNLTNPPFGKETKPPTRKGHGGENSRANDDRYKVSLQDVLEFVFPKRIQHPKSRALLYIFANYGPPVNGRLMGGARGNHVVTDGELETMVEQVERDDILSVYTKMKGLSRAAGEELYSQADPLLKRMKSLLDEEVEELLQDVPRDENGKMDFYVVQRKIMENHNNLVNTYKMKRTPAKFVTKVERKLSMAHKRCERALDRVQVLENAKGLDSFEAVHYMLNRNSYKIAPVTEKDNPALVQNVKILRTLAQHTNWDDNCCVRGTGTGTFVRTQTR